MWIRPSSPWSGGTWTLCLKVTIRKILQKDLVFMAFIISCTGFKCTSHRCFKAEHTSLSINLYAKLHENKLRVSIILREHYYAGNVFTYTKEWVKSIWRSLFRRPLARHKNKTYLMGCVLIIMWHNFITCFRKIARLSKENQFAWVAEITCNIEHKYAGKM